MQAMVLAQVSEMLLMRAEQPAFHPAAPVAVPINADNDDDGVVAAVLPALESEDSIVSLVNVLAQRVEVSIAPWSFLSKGGALVDVVSGVELVLSDGEARIELEPYGVMWLKKR